MALFHCQCCRLLFFLLFGFLISHECYHTFGTLLTLELLCWAIILSPYPPPPPRKPASGLVLCSGNDAVNNNWYCRETVPLSPLLAADGPPVKICPGSLYYGAAVIAPEDGNTLRASVRSHRLMCPDMTMFSHKGVIALSWFVCSVNEPSGAIHTHRIMESWDGGRRSIFCRPSGGF